MREATASRPVSRPVLREKRISRLMMPSDRLNPVRDRWRRKIRVMAIATSLMALVILTARLRSKFFWSSANVSYPSLRDEVSLKLSESRTFCRTLCEYRLSARRVRKCYKRITHLDSLIWRMRGAAAQMLCSKGLFTGETTSCNASYKNNDSRDIAMTH